MRPTRTHTHQGDHVNQRTELAALPRASAPRTRPLGTARPDPESTGCPCCADPPGTLLQKDGYTFFICQGCGSAWLDPVPDATPTLYERDYFQGSIDGGYLDYESDEDTHRKNALQRLQTIRRAGVTAPGSMLDVGCAVGFFLDVAQAAGWRVRGVEVSRWARERATTRFGLPIARDLSEVESASRDVLTCYQVLEHMPDPAAALGEMWRCLRPGGLLVVETWDRGSWIARLMGRHWQQVTPPTVLHLFSREGLTRLLEANGFVDVRLHRTSKRVSLGFVGNLLANKWPRLMGPFARLTSSRPLRAWSVAYGLGDLVCVTARPAG